MSFFTITPRWDDLYFEGIPTHDLVFITHSDDPAEIYRQVETEAAKEGLFFQPFLIRPALSHRRTGELTYGPMSIVMPPKGIQLGHNFNIDDYIFTHEGVKFVRVPVFKLRIGFRYVNSFPRGYNIHIYISPGFHTVTPHGDFGLEENNAERNAALIKLMTDHFDSESFYFAHISSYCFEGHSDVYGVGVPGSAAAGRILQTLPAQTPAVQTIPLQSPAPQSTEPRGRGPRMPHPRKYQVIPASSAEKPTSFVPCVQPLAVGYHSYQPRKSTSFVPCAQPQAVGYHSHQTRKPTSFVPCAQPLAVGYHSYQSTSFVPCAQPLAVGYPPHQPRFSPVSNLIEPPGREPRMPHPRKHQPLAVGKPADIMPTGPP